MNPNDGFVNIHGREYETVEARIRRFRADHPLWTIRTVIVDVSEKRVLMEATIMEEGGRLVSNGHAEEWRESSAVNRTSMIENAETSCIGRALASLGYTGGGSFASAQEIESAKRKEAALQTVTAPAESEAPPPPGALFTGDGRRADRPAVEAPAEPREIPALSPKQKALLRVRFKEAKCSPDEMRQLLRARFGISNSEQLSLQAFRELVGDRRTGELGLLERIANGSTTVGELIAKVIP
jgi:hypothetical protein